MPNDQDHKVAMNSAENPALSAPQELQGTRRYELLPELRYMTSELPSDSKHVTELPSNSLNQR